MRRSLERPSTREADSGCFWNRGLPRRERRRPRPCHESMWRGSPLRRHKVPTAAGGSVRKQTLRAFARTQNAAAHGAGSAREHSATDWNHKARTSGIGKGSEARQAHAADRWLRPGESGRLLLRSRDNARLDAGESLGKPFSRLREAEVAGTLGLSICHAGAWTSQGLVHNP